jgi:hypothetical protein
MTQPEPCCCFVGMLAAEEALFEAAAVRLSAELGPVAAVSPVWPFTQTHYYDDELGSGILRCFYTFGRLVEEDDLRRMKLLSAEVETAFRRDPEDPLSRRINLDPGILAHGRVVLASGKNFAHRIYLGEGVFAELTYVFQSKAWQPLPWTYPDYRTPEVRRFFEELRETYLRQRRLFLGAE